MASPDSRLKQASALRVAVIGAGVIGLSCALDLLQRGAAVSVFEAGHRGGEGATRCAAGMLGVGFEAAGGGDDPLFRLARRSLELWEGVAAERGAAVGYSRSGALACALTAADEDRLRMLAAACEARGLPAAWLSGADARRMEPGLSRRVRAAVRLPQDRQVDARVLQGELVRALEAAGGEVRYGQAVERIAVGAGADRGFTLDDGRVWDRVVIATGAGARPVFARGGEALDDGMPAIRPVKGQMLALERYAGAPAHVIRLDKVYVAPKDRWILVGATSEPGRSDSEVEPHVLARLRAAAADAVNGIAEARQVDAWAGVRPATADGAPMIGESAIPGVFAAMGHYRNGILLAPGTAERMADLILDGKVSADAAAFDPLRFDNRVEAPHSRFSEA